MTTAQEILKLIETVDPTDTAKLDEIDALVYCYLHDFRMIYRSHERRGAWIFVCANTLDNQGMYSDKILSFYTRSRDALKAIRPEGWLWYGAVHKEMSSFVYYKIVDGQRVETDCYDLPTEELAELHAIIQAIEFERTQKGE